ncbi:MAG: polyphosphate polymerase domain-containing protein [Spirosomataceae bacterium]
MILLPIAPILQRNSDFEPISLSEMDTVKLLNRTDTKYLFANELLPDLLERLRPHYQMLEINGRRGADYQTLYFDTPQLELYHAHQSGRLNRYKIRQRSYVNTGLKFTEIKHKNNKGRTIKTRLEQELPLGDLQQPCLYDFLTQGIPHSPNDLKPILWVDYTRLTLVNLQTNERVTLDLNLTFRNQYQQIGPFQVVIAEVKQDKAGGSFFARLMKEHHIREGGISKYCLGVLSLYPNVKQNRFKRKFNQFKKAAQLI